MKVVQINAVYGVGSTGRIVQDISKKLIDQGHESYVFWATGCRADDHAQLIRIGSTLDHKLHAVLRRLDGKQGWHSKMATRKTCKQIAKFAPDVVHLHNLHSNFIYLPKLLQFLGEHNIPTLITLHDCWMFTAGCCTHYFYHKCDEWKNGCVECPAVCRYRQSTTADMYRTKRTLYTGMQFLAVNGISEWTTEDAKNSMLKSAKWTQCIYNWVDTEVFKPQNNASQIREKYGVPENHKLILGVSQGWSDEKGLAEFLMVADALRESATIILVGQDRGVPRKPNLRCIGFTSNRQALVDLYSAADLLLNPSKAETFGLVTAEAMACGTPVVAYNNSGASELVVQQCGAMAPDGDKTALIECVKNVLLKGKAYFSTACRQRVCDNFEKEKQLQKYLDYYAQLIAESKS